MKRIFPLLLLLIPPLSAAAQSPPVQMVSQGKGNAGSSAWDTTDPLVESRLATLLTLVGVGFSFDGSGNLKVNVEVGGGGGGGSNASVGTTGSTIPTSGTYVGGVNGGNLVGISVDSSGRQNVNVNGTVPVSGTFWQATQPVSGTFWQTTQPISSTDLGGVADAAWGGSGSGSLIAVGKATYAALAAAAGQAIPAGTNTIGAVIPKNGLTRAGYSISLSASTGNYQVTATPTNTAHLRQILLVPSAACTVQFTSGSGGTALSGVISLAALAVYSLPFPATSDDSYLTAGATATALFITETGTATISGFSSIADY